MAVYGPLETRTYQAAADLSAVQYHVMRNTNGATQCNISSQDVASDMIGVLQNAPAAAGRAATIAVGGRSKVTIGAAVNSAGVYLTTNGSGRAIAATSGDMVFGKAASTGGADGVIISADVFVPFRWSGAV